MMSTNIKQHSIKDKLPPAKKESRVNKNKLQKGVAQSKDNDLQNIVLVEQTLMP